MILAAAGLALGACGKPATSRDKADAAQAQEVGYLTPPTPDTVRLDASGVVLAGRGPAGGKVRLAQPNGQAVFAPVDAGGRWAIGLGPADQPRIFGLSATQGGHTAQAEGYVLVTPKGQAALLRAGAAAVRIDSAAGPGFRAIDFDGGGGVQVAASVPPRAAVILRLDGRQVAQGRADEAGRYVASLPPASPRSGRARTSWRWPATASPTAPPSPWGPWRPLRRGRCVAS